MPNGDELEKLKKEVDNLKKQKIIMQAKLKQKEDKITELNRKIRDFQIESKESGSSRDLERRIKELEDDLNRSKKVNQSLRAEANRLVNELEESKKALKSASKVAATSSIQPASIPSEQAENVPSNEELEYLKTQLIRKDKIISRLNEQLEMINPQTLATAGGSYMKIRQLNSKIRELKSQVELAKKSEASMKERLLELERTKAIDDDLLKW
ncbi:MAG: hypothetical protein ACTSR8_16535 [Promethearchaeota archaeon]